MITTAKISIITTLLNRIYPINTFGWELKRTGTFVEAVLKKLGNEESAEEIITWLDSINPDIHYNDFVF